MDEVLKLIKSEDFDKALKKIEEELKSEILDEKTRIRYYYLIAVINSDYKNSNKNINKAKKYIKLCINSKFVEEEYYVLYIKLEDNRIITESVVNNALKKFPKSQYLNQLLFNFKNDEGKNELYLKIRDTALFKEDFIILYMKYFFNKRMWTRLIELEKYIKKVKRKIHHILINFALGVAKAMNSSDKEQLILAKEQLEFTLYLDDTNVLENNLHIFLAYCYMKLDIKDNFKEIISKLPVAIKYMDLDLFPPFIEINFLSIYKLIFPEMIRYCAKEKKYKNRILVIYALYLFYPSTFFSTVRFTKKHINDILVNKYLFDDSIDYYKSLCVMYNALGDKENAVKTFLKIPNFNFFDIEMSFEYILKDVSIDEINSYEADIIDFVVNRIYYDKVCEFVINPFIERCYNLKAYELIYKVCSSIGIKNIISNKYSLPLFKMAFSIKEYDVLFSRSIYELSIEMLRAPEALNNLGTIYEEMGYLSKASDLFNEALKLDEFDVIYKRNCERISKRILKQNQAKSKLLSESFDFLEILLMLSSQRDKYNLVNIDNIDFTKLEGLTKENIRHYYNIFILNDFYIKVDDKIVVDMDLLEILNDFAGSIRKNREYKKIADSINYEALNDIEYNDDLMMLLDKIKDKDFCKILKRDLKECAIAYVSGQYKSTVILGGSIIEAILTYILKQNGIVKYKFDNRGQNSLINLERMGIEQLLFVAKEEKLINSTIYHLDHYVREYRNAIHPSAEIRKNYEIDKKNATMIWEILKETIFSILG